jgi:acetyl esterase/lipase
MVGVALAAATSIGLIIVVRRALRSRGVIEHALQEALGSPTRLTSLGLGRWARILLWPFPWWPRRHVKRIRNLAYGPAGRDHLLDVYRPRRRPATGPILIHLHGGGFRTGSKVLDGQSLINRLVARGWVCVSANYRLGRRATFPDQLIDAKRVIAWVREHGHEYGGDPAQLSIAGSSAGGHLAATAALTAGDLRFQPGFETADTTVSAAIGLYAYPGPIDSRGPASSPHDHIASTAPPFLLAHGDRDTIVIVDDFRAFRDHLRTTSRRPVVSVELPGGHHDFDLFHSIRCEAVIDGIERFLVAVAGTPMSDSKESSRRETGPPG